MKALLALALLISATFAMRRVVLTERKMTPLNELWLLEGTQVDSDDFLKSTNHNMETFTRPELR